MNLSRRNFFSGLAAGVAFAVCVSGTAFGMPALKEISLTTTKACFYQGTNGKATYIEFGGEGHGIWDRVYNEPGLGKWLFSNRRIQIRKGGKR